jgi:hypothetical protein
LCATYADAVFDADLTQLPLTVTQRVLTDLAQMHRKFWDTPVSDRTGLPVARDFTWMANFVYERFPAFMIQWGDKMTEAQCQRLRTAVAEFSNTQDRLSDGRLTLCHGDAKAANICFVTDSHENIPIFCDWQYASWGKGAQDLVFFLTASLPVSFLRLHAPLLIRHYFVSMAPHYSWFTFCEECRDAAGFFPLFVAVCFGTLPTDELIDKTFPATFIERFLAFLDLENDLNDIPHDL